MAVERGEFWVLGEGAEGSDARISLHEETLQADGTAADMFEVEDGEVWRGDGEVGREDGEIGPDDGATAENKSDVFGPDATKSPTGGDDEAEAVTERVPSAKKTGRYFVDDELLCKRCGLRGHFEWECKEKEEQVRCHQCGQEGHVSRECTNQACFSCHQMGHIARSCPNKGTQQALYRSQSNPDTEPSPNLTLPPFVPLPIPITCFVCQGDGHLMCTQTGVRTLSGSAAPHCCYNCGEHGHIGSSCGKPNSEATAKWTRLALRDLLPQKAEGGRDSGGRRGRGPNSVLRTLNTQELRQFWVVVREEAQKGARREVAQRRAGGYIPRGGPNSRAMGHHQNRPPTRQQAHLRGGDRPAYPPVFNDFRKNSSSGARHPRKNMTNSRR